jgi:hypothetical protein
MVKEYSIFDSISKHVIKKFNRLKDEWKAATKDSYSSSTRDLCTEPSYQHIIGMGPVAVPLILRELETEVDHWHWALNAITEENPVPAGDEGKLSKMTEAWLKWAEEKGCYK